MKSNTNGGAVNPPTKQVRLLRKVAGWIITCVILPAALLAAFEIFLRMAGYGQCMDPFLRQTMNGETVYVRNKAFLDQFFDHPFTGDHWHTEIFSFAIPKTKASNAYRIFVFGSSAAMGWPEGKHSFSSLLNLMLTSAYPDVRVS